MTDKEKFKELLELDYTEDFEIVTKGFLELLQKTNRNSIKDSDIFFQLGSCYYFSDFYMKAAFYFNQYLKIDASYEAASLGLYLSLVKLNKTSEAIKELDRYCSNFSINLYRDTLTELVDGLKDNNGTAFLPIIIKLVEMHDIPHVGNSSP